MRNKTYAIIAFVALLSFALVSLALARSGAVLHLTQSNNERYKVEIIQKRFLIERAVYLNAYRNGEQIVWHKLLYTGDFFDNDFPDLYPRYVWVSDSILQIGRNVNDPEKKFSSLKVVNELANPISYLLLETSGNKIVLFDVEPQTAVNLRFPFSV